MIRLKLLARISSVLICLVTTFVHTNAQSLGSDRVIISISTTPTGATVIIDGTTAADVTPFKVPVTLGAHTFQIMLKGFPDWQGTYSVIGTDTGFYAALDNSEDVNKVYLANERKPAFINLLMPLLVTDWWATTDDVVQLAPQGRNGVQLYNYNVQKGTASNTDLPLPTLVDPAIRRTLSLPARNGNDVFTAAYQSPSGRYTLQTQHLDQTNFTFTLIDTANKQTYATAYKWSSNSDTATDERSYNPTWSSDEQLVWLDAWMHNSDPTILWIQGGQVKTLHLTGFNSPVGMGDGGGMYTRPSGQGYALIWGRIFNITTGVDSPPAPYLVDLHTLNTTPLPIPDGDVPNLTGMIFSPDGQWIYLGTKEGIKRINVQNLNDIEMVDPTISEANKYQLVDFSYTLHYALVEGAGINSSYFLYKMPNPDSSPVKIPTIIPSTATPTGGSAPGGNQVGG